VTSAATLVNNHGGPWPKNTKQVMMTSHVHVIFLEALPETNRNRSVLKWEGKGENLNWKYAVNIHH